MSCCLLLVYLWWLRVLSRIQAPKLQDPSLQLPAANVASARQEDLIFRLLDCTDRLEKVVVSTEKSNGWPASSPRGSDAAKPGVDCHERPKSLSIRTLEASAQAMLLNTTAQNDDGGPNTYSIPNNTNAAVAMSAMLEQVQNNFTRFSADLTDLRVQLRTLNDAAKTAEKNFTSLSEAHDAHLMLRCGNGLHTLHSPIEKEDKPRIAAAEIGGFDGHFVKLNTETSLLDLSIPTNSNAESRDSRRPKTSTWRETKALMTVINKYDLQHLMLHENMCWDPKDIHHNRVWA